MAIKVICEADRCKNWSTGNVCLANAIHLAGPEAGDLLSGEEAGCRTFEQKALEVEA